VRRPPRAPLRLLLDRREVPLRPPRLDEVPRDAFRERLRPPLRPISE
jgi:hypothetical protein